MNYEKILYQLQGYYAGRIDGSTFVASDMEARATYQDLFLTDNPFYWLMIVLKTRGLTSVQIYCALAEIGAIDCEVQL